MECGLKSGSAADLTELALIGKFRFRELKFGVSRESALLLKGRLRAGKSPKTANWMQDRNLKQFEKQLE